MINPRPWLSLEQYHEKNERMKTKSLGISPYATEEELEDADDTEEEHQSMESWHGRYI